MVQWVTTISVQARRPEFMSQVPIENARHGRSPVPVAPLLVCVRGGGGGGMESLDHEDLLAVHKPSQNVVSSKFSRKPCLKGIGREQ